MASEGAREEMQNAEKRQLSQRCVCVLFLVSLMHIFQLKQLLEHLHTKTLESCCCFLHTPPVDSTQQGGFRWLRCSLAVEEDEAPPLASAVVFC